MKNRWYALPVTLVIVAGVLAANERHAAAWVLTALAIVLFIPALWFEPRR